MESKTKNKVSYRYQVPEQPVISKALVLTDTQIPYQIEAVTSGILEYAKEARIDTLVWLGDILDLTGLQGWEKKAPEMNDWTGIIYEEIAANLVLDAYDKALPDLKRKLWWMGNHELRLKFFMEKYGPRPGREGGSDWYHNNWKVIPNLIKDLRLKERGYKVHDQFDIDSIGKLKLFHGGEYSDINEKKTLMMYCCSIMYGHVHRPGRYTKISPVSGRPQSAWSIPCLCDRNPRWKRGAPNAWSNGFAVVYVLPNGNFNPYIVDIIDGHFVAPNGRYY